MKRNGFSLILIVLLLLAGLLMAATVLSPRAAADATAVNAANQLYTAGHYNEAIQLYEEQVARGVQDSALFFNLGNAYFQQGDVGRAVLNLERAAQLNPRDADIAINLALVREQTTELFAEEPVGPLAVLADITSWLTENETAVLLLGFWFLLGFLLLIRRHVQTGRAQRLLQIGMVLALALLLITGASLASRSFLQQTQPAGVVVSPTVAVSSGPGAEFVTNFNISGGTTVNVSETQGKWVRLAMPEGAGENWLPAEAVERVAQMAPILS
jgi:tetratricopeptide (TPR) repeat protein